MGIECKSYGKRRWNKGKVGLQEGWNKGLTKNDNPNLKGNTLPHTYMNGDKNPNWKGGILDENQAIRLSPEHKNGQEI